MVMLSKLWHFRLRHRSGQKYGVTDVAVALLESDYPVVTHLLYQGSKGQMMLPWSTVEKIDWRRSQIEIRNFETAKSVTSESLGKEVLLRRDVIDALVLDLHNRRATRANDLWLELESGQLLLKAADTTSRAVLRRLSRGLFGGKPSRAPYDWKYIEFLRGDPHAVKNGAGYHMRIKRLPPGEIAGLSNALPYLHAAELLTLLPDPIAHGAFVPTLRKDPDYIFLLVGLMGTTVTPYMQIFQQSSIVERGADRRRYLSARRSGVTVIAGHFAARRVDQLSARTDHHPGSQRSRESRVRMLRNRSTRIRSAAWMKPCEV